MFNRYFGKTVEDQEPSLRYKQRGIKTTNFMVNGFNKVFGLAVIGIVGLLFQGITMVTGIKSAKIANEKGVGAKILRGTTDILRYTALISFN